MSHAVIALLLLRLQARCGAWVPVADLCGHLALSRPVVVSHLLALQASGDALLRNDARGLVDAAAAPGPRADDDAEPNTGPASADRPLGAPGVPGADFAAVYGPYIAPAGHCRPRSKTCAAA